MIQQTGTGNVVSVTFPTPPADGHEVVMFVATDCKDPTISPGIGFTNNVSTVVHPTGEVWGIALRGFRWAGDGATDTFGRTLETDTSEWHLAAWELSGTLGGSPGFAYYNSSAAPYGSDHQPPATWNPPQDACMYYGSRVDAGDWNPWGADSSLSFPNQTLAFNWSTSLGANCKLWTSLHPGNTMADELHVESAGVSSSETEPDGVSSYTTQAAAGIILPYNLTPVPLPSSVAWRVDLIERHRRQ